METSLLRKRMPVTALTDPKIVVPAIGSAFAKLNPRAHDEEPGDVRGGSRRRAHHRHLHPRMDAGGEHIGFTFQIIIWLWFTVLFANFAEAVAEGRGKAQAAPCARRAKRPRPSSSSMKRRG